MKNVVKALCMCLILVVLSTQALAASDYVWPTDSPHSLSRNYAKHSYKAIDISVSAGAPVYASRSGKVYAAYTGCRNWNGLTAGTCKDRGLCNPNCGYFSNGYCNNGFGNGVIIQHDDGTYAHYAHFSEVYVKRGDSVSQGQKIGTAGNYGYSNGAHLHFELHSAGITPWKGACINPEPLLNGKSLPPEQSVDVVTTTADTITETSTILRGSFTTTGDRATECGMLLGTSEGNMTKLGSDKVNTYGTSMFYSTAKYGRTLEPGTTYYYQAYATVNKTTYKGETKSFITSGTRPESLSISLNRDNLTLAYNTCDKLIATTNPAGISVTWKSSDASVVTVTDGVVATVEAGTAYITAEVSHGGKTASAICYVTVKEEDKPEVRVTTKGADGITATSAIVRGNVSVSNGTATECGMYFGNSASNLSFLGSDAINSSDMPFYYSTSKYGWTLMSGTTYYYRAYAIVNGVTYWGETESFTTAEDVPTASVTVTTKGADNITQTSAIVRGNVSVSNGTATECGMYFGNSASGLSFLGSDAINSSNMPFYYSTSKYGWTLMSGTTYYYRAYAIVNGVTYWGETESFTTAEDVLTASVTVTTKGADNITQTSAIVRGSVSVSNGTATECGMYFGNSASDLSFLGSDAINSSNMPFYYSTSKYGWTLMSGTTYYYRAYAIVNGVTYWGETKSFTTEASALVSNTRTAVVVNTNGSYLAINDRAAASPKYSNQIGRIPPAGVVTVYPEKTSGNWYYIEYNGVSGYAYSKYLSLQ